MNNVDVPDDGVLDCRGGVTDGLTDGRLALMILRTGRRGKRGYSLIECGRGWRIALPI